MNRIKNTTSTGRSTSQQANLHKPIDNHASRRSIEGDPFRGGRTSSAIPASPDNDHSSQAPRTTRREFNSSGNPNGGRGNSPSPSGRDPKNKKRIAMAALLGAILMLTGIGVWKCSQPSSIDEVTGGWFYDQDSTAIQEAIDHEVQDGYFNMSINTSVPVSEGTALMGIKNIPDNKFDCVVTVTLEDGTEIYKSGGLAPGNELKLVTLNQNLPAGDYKATALFEIYEQDEAHTKVGQTASKLTLHVK